MKNTTNIIYIEPNAILRKGLSLFFLEQPAVSNVRGYENLGQVPEEILAETDLMLFDTQEDAEFQKIRQWKATYSGLKTAILSSEKRLFENYLFAQTGSINAIFTKSVRPEILAETLKPILNSKQGKLIMVEDIREILFGEENKDSCFTDKERKLLDLLGKGKTTRETARILNLSFRTVETHRRRMIEKLGCRNIIPVILYALENGDIRINSDDFLDTGFYA